MSAEVHIVYGQGVARRVFAKRGNHSEAHLSEVELAAIAALAYADGLRDSGRDRLLAALREIEARWNSPGISPTQDLHYMGNVARLAIEKVEGTAS